MKHKLSVKFSYVTTVYEVWNNDNTLNVLLTSCAINIFCFLPKKQLFYPTHKLGSLLSIYFENFLVVLCLNTCECKHSAKKIFNDLKNNVSKQHGK